MPTQFTPEGARVRKAVETGGAPTFRTFDLQLAAYLVTLGHPLLGVEGPRERRVFVFDGVTEADRVGYFGDTRLVSARRLFNEYRSLRNAIFEVA